MTEIANVNFQILLKMHNGNFARAKEAWEGICKLGRYGDVPHTYEGGLDVKGLRIALDEQQSGQHEYEVRTGARGVQMSGSSGGALPEMSPTLADDLKRIEDLASGDRPK